MRRTRTSPISNTGLRVAVLLVGAGCGPSPGGQAADRPIPGSGPAYSSLAPSPELDALAADFRGSCAFAKPPGVVGDYPARIRARADQTPDHTIDVRSTAEFELSDQGTNRIGRVRGGALLAAAGPLAAGGDRGIGWAVLVRDGDGRVCRGYVAAASVDQVPR
jgi:hypothetical protein